MRVNHHHKAFLFFVLALVAPAAAFAQASITGVVKDNSGAILPGVTVEAASNVLIEKVRSTSTDNNGRFQLVDLRPGAYVVSFTLAGFNVFRRDGVVLTGSGTATVDAELRIGGLQETVTVTGESPLVDVRSTTRQQVLDADMIDALPSSRNYQELARLIPGTVGGGADVGGREIQDVGGSVTVHGSRTTDQRVTLNGINTMTLQAGGGIGGQIPDVGSAGEITVDTSSLSADLPTGGVRINFIPRDGGNQFRNSTFFTFSNTALQSNNYTPALQAAGLAAPNKIKQNWDLNESLGGPFQRDKLWFWFSARYNGTETYAPIFVNRNAYDVTKWTYDPDPSRQAVEKGRVVQSSLRVTWQASPRNKVAGTYKADRWCNCPDNISATIAPEAGRDRRFPRLRQEHVEWTSPVTSRLLFEAVGMHLYERWGNMHLRVNGGSLESAEQEAAIPHLISVTEQSQGLTYRAANFAEPGPFASGNFNNTRVPNYAYRGAMSYITGTHAFKVGFNRTHGYLEAHNYVTNPLSYRFNNGIPNQVSISARPFTTRAHMDNDLGVYVQDRWSMDRVTVQLALRYDYFATSFPEQTLGPSQFTPTRNITFPAEDNLGYKDITYRSGASWDLFGTGRTAIKAAFNKYLLGQTLNGLATNVNPINRLTATASRTWNDVDGDYVVDCNLLNFAAQNVPGGDICGAVPGSQANFGNVNAPSDFFDPDVLRGWGKRQFNYEISAGLQHEVLPRVSVDVGWFRRIWGNFQVVDNENLGPGDYDYFSLRVPSDPRLPDGGGYVLEGLRNLKPTSFGRPARNYTTLSDKIVEGGQIEHGDYIDVTVNARPRAGLSFQMGVSTGKTTEDDCAIVERLPELNAGANMRPLQFCHRETPWNTQVKGYGIYTVPKIDVQVSGTFRSTDETAINANFTATNAYIAANGTLGRLLSGTTGPNDNITVALLEPNTRYLDRRHELDLRFGKILRYGRSRAVASVDVYNALNSNALLSVNQSFGSWLTPTSILNPRVVKFSVQYDF